MDANSGTIVRLHQKKRIDPAFERTAFIDPARISLRAEERAIDLSLTLNRFDGALFSEPFEDLLRENPSSANLFTGHFGTPRAAGLGEPAAPIARKARILRNELWEVIDHGNHSPKKVTAIFLSRGRLSKSMNMICCHVPRIRPSRSKGTVREGPTREDLKCEWPLPSPQASS